MESHGMVEKVFEIPRREWSLHPKAMGIRDYVVGKISRGEAVYLIKMCGRRGAKAQPLEARVYTPEGWVRMGDLKEGDEIITDEGDGRVEGIYPQGEEDVYAVEFGDGAKCECSWGHLWEIEERRVDSNWKKRVRVVTTEEIAGMASLRGTNRKPVLAEVGSVEFKKREISLDPYLLGILLGDGGFTQGGVRLSAYDEFIREQVKGKLPEGVYLAQVKNKAKEVHDYYVTSGRLRKNTVINELRKLGLMEKGSHEKFIPDVYKYNTKEVRLGVIQGLLDTDGYVKTGQPVLNQTSEQLAADFTEVIQSLGGLVKTSKKKAGYKKDGIYIRCKDTYNQSVLYKDSSELFLLPTKKEKTRLKKQPVRRYFKSVKLIGRKQTQCIKVNSKRGIYFTDNLIATHNTTLDAAIGGEVFGKYRKSVLYGAPTVSQTDHYWFEIMRMFGELVDKGALKADRGSKVLWYPKTEIKIDCRTAWNAGGFRGGTADLIQFDEYHLMNEDILDRICWPMMMDRNGSFTFSFTVPSLRDEGISKAKDPRHATKLFREALKKEQAGDKYWKAERFTSLENGYLSKEGIAQVTANMSPDAYRKEILAIDDDVESSWMVYDFPEICRIKRFAIPKDSPVVSGHDFGKANPAALFAVRIETLPEGAPSMLRRGDMVIYGEYHPRGGEYDAHIENFKRITRDMRVVKSVGGNLTTEGETRQLYTNAGWRIGEPGLDGKVGAQIDMVRHLMANKRIYIFDDLPFLWADICGMMFKISQDGVPLNDIQDEKKYHMAACFIKGTMITTDKGQVPIESIKIGDKVLTRQGYHKVIAAGETGEKKVMTVTFSNGESLTGTPEHPIFVKGKGFVDLAALRYGDIIETCQINKFTTALPTIGIQLQREPQIEPTSIVTDTGCIRQYGNILMVKFLWDIVSTIKTKIHSITKSETLNYLLCPNICPCIIEGDVRHNNESIWRKYVRLQKRRGLNGQKLPKDKKISSPVLINNGQNANLSRELVDSVAIPINQNRKKVMKNFVPTNANLLCEGNLKRILYKVHVLFAEKHSTITNTTVPSSVQVSVSRSIEKKAKVYNLSVDAVPEYFANGILVHNCLRYMCSVSEFNSGNTLEREHIKVSHGW